MKWKYEKKSNLKKKLLKPSWKLLRLSICLLSLPVLGLLGNFIPQANATLSGSNFVTEIITAPAGIDVIDVDSQGRLFAIANNDVYRSLDQGVTWTKLLANVNLSVVSRNYMIRVDSRDYIYADLEVSSKLLHTLYRSTDHGETWTPVLSQHYKFWHLDEMSNGTLYVNVYANYHNLIYKSNDEGASWNLFWNFTPSAFKHIHAVAIDDYTDAMYITTGDPPDNTGVWRWNEISGDWNEIANDTMLQGYWKFIQVAFDRDYVYFFTDGFCTNYRMLKNGTSYNDFRAIGDTRWGGKISSNVVWSAFHTPHDVFLFGTDEGQIWGSWDGEHWVKIYDLNATNNRIFSFTGKRPIYATDSEQSKLYRIDVTKEDIIQLYYTQHTQYRGSLTNAENYVLEQRIWNGTNYLDLTKVALQNVETSIEGLSRVNYAPIGNSGFELGNKGGWFESGSPLGTIVTDDKANGTYSYKVVKQSSDTSETYLRSNYISGSSGDIYVLSFYWKANISLSEAMEVWLYDQTGTTLRKQLLTSPTTWIRVTVFWSLPSTSSSATWRFTFRKVGVTHYIDSILLLKLEVGTARWQTAGESYTYFEGLQCVVGSYTIDLNRGYSPITYFDNLENTTNATITIAGQNISYSEELANGTATTPQSLSGILTGAVQVEANIQGSGQALLKITGTRVLYEDSMILKGRKDNVYYGRCYGTFSPTIDTNDLVVVTNLASNITSLSHASNKLTLTIDSPTGTTSTTEVYCGIRGEPTAIYTASGTLTWGYSPSTTILTLNVTHASPTRILVYWKFPGDTDSDGDVDIYDLYVLAVAYGSNAEQPNYSSDSDIDGNNHVNSDDLCILAEDYGELKP